MCFIFLRSCHCWALEIKGWRYFVSENHFHVRVDGNLSMTPHKGQVREKINLTKHSCFVYSSLPTPNFEPEPRECSSVVSVSASCTIEISIKSGGGVRCASVFLTLPRPGVTTRLTCHTATLRHILQPGEMITKSCTIELSGSRELDHLRSNLSWQD